MNEKANGTVRVRNWVTMILSMITLLGIVNMAVFRLLEIETTPHVQKAFDRAATERDSLNRQLAKAIAQRDSVVNYLLCLHAKTDIGADEATCDILIRRSSWQQLLDDYRRPTRRGR